MFCSTVKETETIASRLANVFRNRLKISAAAAAAAAAASVAGAGEEGGWESAPVCDDHVMQERRKDVVENLKSLKGGEGTKGLLKCVMYGVGFHNAGLAKEERKIVEEAFKQGVGGWGNVGGGAEEGVRFDGVCWGVFVRVWA